MRRAIASSATMLIAALLLAGCSATSTEGPTPTDFRLRYDWREGSLPPPYHYEYTITLAADGSAAIVMVPAYPGPGVPSWEEPFTVPSAEVERLYRLMQAQGLLSERWRELDLPPVGGSSASMEVTADGRTVQLPSFPVDGQRERIEAIYAVVEGLVPAAIRADLEQRREAYMAANPGP